MAIFDKVKKAFKKAGDAVSNVVNKAADAISDVFESVGNAIGDALSWLGGKIPGIGPFFSWLGDIVSGITDVVAAAIKWVGGIFAGILSGVIKIIGGILSIDFDIIVEAAGDIVSGILGGLVLILGKVWALIQVIFTVGQPRRLNKIERDVIRRVFHDAIATYNVRVVDGNAGLYSVNNRPFVLGNIIYLKNKSANANPDEFAHECVHIWQNQHLGSRYVSDALASQWWGAGYAWEREANAGKDWADFEVEAQGEFIEDVYKDGESTSGSGSTGNGAFFDESDPSKRKFVQTRRLPSGSGGIDRTTLANEATETLRDPTPWRLSEIRD